MTSARPLASGTSSASGTGGVSCGTAMTFRSSAGAAATGAGVVAGVTPAGASSTVVASTAASGAAAVPGAARYVSGMSPGCRSVGGVLVVVTLPASASAPAAGRSEEHTSELQSLMRISYAVFCLKKKTYNNICHKRQNDISLKNIHTHK